MSLKFVSRHSWVEQGNTAPLNVAVPAPNSCEVSEDLKRISCQRFQNKGTKDELGSSESSESLGENSERKNYIATPHKSPVYPGV